MTEPNATPAPLTSERCSKRVPMAGVWFRDAQCSRKAVGMFDGAPLCRQHSPAAKAARDAKYEAKFKARLARDMAPTVRLSEALAELDATRAKLAEAEAQRDEHAAQLCDQAAETIRAVGLLRDAKGALTAAESRVAALTEAIRSYLNHEQGNSTQSLRAALSPSQDAKDGGAV